MMSIFLAEDLERFTKDSPDAVSLEFFCDNKNNKRNTADSIIQGLVFQLLHKRKELIQHILPAFAIQQASLFSGSSFESLWRIFEDMTCDPMLRTIYCVLDGLDECNKASLEVLLKHFKALFSKNMSGTGSSHLNLIAVSRDDPDIIGDIIGQLLSEFPRIQLDLDAGIEVNKDITRFIDAKLDKIFFLKKYPQSTRVKVKNIFRERAQGTFLWIGIAAKTLEGYSAIEYGEALERLPPGLDELYARILLGIEVGHRKIAARILRWVVMAVRPLTLSELSAVIEPTVEPPTGFTRERVTKDQVSYCGSFLMIKGYEVNLIHQSAKDYLLRGDCGSNPKLTDFRMDEKAGNHEIVRKCLQYLEDNLRAIGDMDGRRIISHFEAFPLLSYATRHWHRHARSLPSSDDVFDLSRLFYRKDSPIRELWLKINHDLAKDPYDTSPISSKLLHVASYFDILPLAEKLLDQEGFVKLVKRFHSINEKDSKGKTALHRAAQGGHLATARLLLSKGANVNAKDNRKEIPLHTAATYGHRELIQLLLKNGADINAKDRHNKTALYTAAANGYEGIVRLLLEKGADINAKNKRGAIALHQAACSGDGELVRLLLERGADINMKDLNKETPLHIAASFGQEGIIHLLVEVGADVNARDENDMTALHRVAERGYERTTRLLLDRGADFNAKNKDGMTALHNAAQWGNKGVVRLLLEMGADINSKTEHGTTALDYASVNVHEGVVQLLLSMGAVSENAPRSYEWNIFTAESASVATMRAEFARRVVG